MQFCRLSYVDYLLLLNNLLFVVLFLIRNRTMAVLFVPMLEQTKTSRLTTRVK